MSANSCPFLERMVEAYIGFGSFKPPDLGAAWRELFFVMPSFPQWGHFIHSFPQVIHRFGAVEGIQDADSSQREVMKIDKEEVL